MMLPEVATSESSVATFLREVELTRQLRHPNVVEMIDYGEVRGTFYCVLEFIDGMDLQKYIEMRGGKVGLEEAAPLMMDILAGLAHAHEAELTMKIAGGKTRAFHGMVHRDIKPQNVLLARTDSSYAAKVADFGLAKSFESAGLTDMTTVGNICGTPIYWPREQITHYKYLAPPSDVFSIGSVFYEMLTGSWARDGFQQMFQQCQRRQHNPGMADIMGVIVNNAVPSLRTRNSEIPKPVAEVIDRAVREAEVSIDETKMRQALASLRYANAGAFRDALGKALRESGIPV
jgi:serine/threonine protein kinase